MVRLVSSLLSLHHHNPQRHQTTVTDDWHVNSATPPGLLLTLRFSSFIHHYMQLHAQDTTHTYTLITHKYIHTHIFIFTYIHIHTKTCTYPYTSTSTSTSTNTNTNTDTNTDTDTDTYTCTCKCTCTYNYNCVCDTHRKISQLVPSNVRITGAQQI